ncbi:MAG: O-succinylbenzoate--CoA ligase [Cyanobium sp. CACIAM 14]|nr:MAG: O-succinylbenzoate--CoA ligase [Cyanobium sp. CACIAM 14]
MAGVGSGSRPPLLLRERDPVAFGAALERAWRQEALVALAAPEEEPLLAEALAADPDPSPQGPSRESALPAGPGVLVPGGGSSGGRRWCLQPLAHLEASAGATGAWLEALGIDPAACLHLNPLPFHHVSGLMPLLRARQWRASHRRLAAGLMRDPDRLPEAAPHPPDRPVVLSLVPTQLSRLLGSAAASAWLRQCTVIWVGGASLPPELARRARGEEIPLAPCYGATETAAMVCALTPERFLAGGEGCGSPLADVRLRLHPGTSALEVKTSRLSPGRLRKGRLEPLPGSDGAGWWRSGDVARFSAGGVEILGRADGAISSGGETVFPEQLERRLTELADRHALPLVAVLLLGRSDPPWGERLVALVRAAEGQDPQSLLAKLRDLTAAWPAHERPRRWCSCPELALNGIGKWERPRWQHWLDSLEAR